MLSASLLVLAVALNLRPSQPGNSRPVVRAHPPQPLPLRNEDTPVDINPAAVSSIGGAHLVQSPNVFRGVSPSGQVLQKLPRLERDEELEVSPHSARHTCPQNAARPSF